MFKLCLALLIMHICVFLFVSIQTASEGFKFKLEGYLFCCMSFIHITGFVLTVVKSLKAYYICVNLCTTSNTSIKHYFPPIPRCVSVDECREKWLEQTSDQGKCVNLVAGSTQRKVRVGVCVCGGGVGVWVGGFVNLAAGSTQRKVYVCVCVCLYVCVCVYMCVSVSTG